MARLDRFSLFLLLYVPLFSFGDASKKQAQLKILTEIIAHELCHAKLWPDGNDNVAGFPARGTPGYYLETLGMCEKKLYKNATGQESPTFKASNGGGWDNSLPPVLQTIYNQHPDYFGSVNAAVKTLNYTPTEYDIAWSPYPKP